MHKYDGILDIKEILNDYSDDIQAAISKDAQSVAQKGVRMLRETTNTYKIRTGKYNKGWRVNTTKGRDSISCVIHNSTNYQLTHLLEKGHRIVGRDGQLKGNVKAFVHIQPVDDYCVKQYEKDVESIIKNGG